MEIGEDIEKILREYAAKLQSATIQMSSQIKATEEQFAKISEDYTGGIARMKETLVDMKADLEKLEPFIPEPEPEADTEPEKITKDDGGNSDGEGLPASGE